MVVRRAVRLEVECAREKWSMVLAALGRWDWHEGPRTVADPTDSPSGVVSRDVV
jgi:hypothetical protein